MIIFRLIYNTTTNRTSNMPGVLTKVPNFGNTSSIEWLDKSKAKEGQYFIDIVDALIKVGYRRGKNLVGAPYDWRRAPSKFEHIIHFSFFNKRILWFKIFLIIIKLYIYIYFIIQTDT